MSLTTLQLNETVDAREKEVAEAQRQCGEPGSRACARASRLALTASEWLHSDEAQGSAEASQERVSLLEEAVNQVRAAISCSLRFHSNTNSSLLQLESEVAALRNRTLTADALEQKEEQWRKKMVCPCGTDLPAWSRVVRFVCPGAGIGGDCVEEEAGQGTRRREAENGGTPERL